MSDSPQQQKNSFAWAISTWLVALLLGVAIDAMTLDLASVRSPEYGQLAPTFTLPRLPATAPQNAPAEPFALESLRGQFVMLDFWATWCGPCRQSMPAMETALKPYHDRIKVVAINIEGPSRTAQAAQFLAKFAPTAIGVMDDGAIADLYKVKTIPHYLLLDPDGKILWTRRGDVTLDIIRKQVVPLITP